MPRAEYEQQRFGLVFIQNRNPATTMRAPFLPQAAKIAGACRAKRGNARAFRC
jgi:hypothetical protein